VVAFLGGRRKRIRAAYEALCAAIATALGGAAASAERVRQQHLDVLAELWLREDGPTAARADPARERLFASSGMAGVVRRVEGAAAAAAPLEAHIPTLERIVAEAATGAAGEPPEQWLGDIGALDPVQGPPELWRIGSARLGASDPFAVAVPLLDESHLQISTVDEETRKAGLGLVEGLLMRVLSAVDPGTAVVHVWDVSQLTGPLPDLHPLSRTGLLTVHDPSGLGVLLEELSDRIRRVHNRVLVDGQPSLAALAKVENQRPEPWVIAVLVGNRQALKDEEQQRQLQRVARGGLDCGVHLVLVDVPMALGAPVETVNLGVQSKVTTSMTDPHMRVELDKALPASAVTAACHRIADADAERRARSGTFENLLPAPNARHKRSDAGLVTRIGFADGDPVDLELVDASPHALIGGPSGSGKTNLLLAMIAGLADRYDPDELEFYLLDFKEGVSFAQLAPGANHEGWLPHARLVGININTDREFGLALLRFLTDELRRRAQVAKERGVTKLEELRRRDERPWPRIVAVIDEFQYLFSVRDAVTTEAIRLLEDVARRGRSQGIHLVLASQDVSSIDAFWGRPAIFEQFVLRIALPRGRRILDEKNDAALHLPRWHAVINHESGMRHGNRVVRVPNASEADTVDEVQKRLYDEFEGRFDEPRLFDGSTSPETDALLGALPAGEPLALVGQLIEVAGGPATVRLPPVPGRNLVVLGPGVRDAVRLLDAAGAGLAATFPAGAADVVLAALIPDAYRAAERLGERFAARGHGVRATALDGFAAQLRELSTEVTRRLEGGTGRPTVVVLNAADAADAILDRTGTEDLRRLVHYGPEVGVHVVGWWRSVPRLRSLLMMGASVDDIGAWVALDVQGTELQPLLPGMLLNWSPRPARGLWFDRAQHANPEVVIVPAPPGEEP
jgi:hypothetical protein